MPAHRNRRIERLAVRDAAEVEFPESDPPDQVGLETVGRVAGGHSSPDAVQGSPQQPSAVEQQIELTAEQTRPADPVHGRGHFGVRRREQTAFDQPADLRRQILRARVLTVPEQRAKLTADDLDVDPAQHRGVQDHRAQPGRILHPQSRRQVAAVGGAVDHRLPDSGVVENRGDVVDDLPDGQRVGGQIDTVVVPPRQPDAAVFDHDDVQTGCRRAPPQPLVGADRGHAGPARDDQHGVLAGASGAHIVQVEPRPAVGRDWTADRAHSRQGGESAARARAHRLISDAATPRL